MTVEIKRIEIGAGFYVELTPTAGMGSSFELWLGHVDYGIKDLVHGQDDYEELEKDMSWDCLNLYVLDYIRQHMK